MNETSKGIICFDVELRDTTEGRRRGLMNSQKKDIVMDIGRDSRLFASIHMFHMNFPIDVIWVNSSFEVVDIRKQIKPSKIWNPRTWNHMPKKKSRYIVELGKTKAYEIKEGDIIKFI